MSVAGQLLRRFTLDAELASLCTAVHVGILVSVAGLARLIRGVYKCSGGVKRGEHEDSSGDNAALVEAKGINALL